MTEAIHRPTVAKISLPAIQANYQAIKDYIPAETKIYAVLKSNAYGHGDIPVAKALVEVGADAFGVAISDEALALRQADIAGDILILGLSSPKDAAILAEADISQTVMSLGWLAEAKAVLQDQQAQHPLKVHVNVDSGMNRIGVKSVAEGQAVIDYLAENKKYFYLEGIYTHLATSDGLDEGSEEKMQAQVDSFNDFRQAIDTSAFAQKIFYHQSNSAMVIKRPDLSLDAVRVGTILYGLQPFEEATDLPFALHPALSLETELVNVKQMHAGETVSYGATYTTKEGEWIGTIPIGYGDGWLRQYIGRNTLIAGEYAPTVGRICMDQAMISLPRQVPNGAKVTLVGRQGDKYISVEEIADNSGTMNTEFTNILGNRIPRVYSKDEIDDTK